MKKLLIMAVTTAVLGFCALSAKAIATYGVTTNYDELNISITVATPKQVTDISGKYVQTITNSAYNNKKILALLSTADFAGEDLTSDKLVVSWDAGENVTNGSYGDILVIDKNGTVYYDASVGTISDGNTNFMSVDFIDNRGAESENYSAPTTGAGHDQYHELTMASFMFYDFASSILEISATGTGAVDFTQNWKALNDVRTYTSGSESESATLASVGYYLTGVDEYQSVKVQISASGHAKGFDDFYENFF